MARKRSVATRLDSSAALIIDSGYVTPYVVARAERPVDVVAAFKTLKEARAAYPVATVTADALRRSARS